MQQEILSGSVGDGVVAKVLGSETVKRSLVNPESMLDKLISFTENKEAIAKTSKLDVGDIKSAQVNLASVEVEAFSSEDPEKASGRVDLPPSGESQYQNQYSVERIPEPLTILGSGLALGLGVYFKKEYSRKSKKAKVKA